MAMGRKLGKRQEELFYAGEAARSPGHPFYERLNRVLAEGGFDGHCERQCAKFYHGKLGRPGLAPGVYFRLLLLGFFEGIGSEREIAWRVADSLSLREFIGYKRSEATPAHVTVVARRGLLKGKTIGIDATTLEANAAMRSIVRRETSESYVEYLKKLAEA